MKKDVTIFLVHIVGSISLIEQCLETVTETSFHASTEKQDIVVRRIEIIGEATKNISADFKQKYPEIPWKKMAGIRDIMSHRYFDIDYNIVWDTAKNILPPLKLQIQEILNSVSN